MKASALGTIGIFAATLMMASGCDYYNRFNAGPPTPLDQEEALDAAELNVEAFIFPNVVDTRENNPLLSWEEAETPADTGMLLAGNNINLGTGMPEQDGSAPPDNVEIAH